MYNQMFRYTIKPFCSFKIMYIGKLRYILVKDVTYRAFVNLKLLL